MKTIKMRVERVEHMDGESPRITLTSSLTPRNKGGFLGPEMAMSTENAPSHFDFECEPGMAKNYPVGAICTIQIVPNGAGSGMASEEAQEPFDNPAEEALEGGDEAAEEMSEPIDDAKEEAAESHPASKRLAATNAARAMFRKAKK